MFDNIKTALKNNIPLFAAIDRTKDFIEPAIGLDPSQRGTAGQAAASPQGIQGIQGGAGPVDVDAWNQYMGNNVNNSNSPAPTGGGSAPAPRPVLNQGAINNTRMNLDALAGILAEALGSAQTGYNNANSLFASQEAQQKGQYDESTLRNMGNYDSNLAAALRAGRSGRQGLMAALRGGGGAGNDFARNWVDDVVGDTTSNDIREGFNTYDENRESVDGSYSTFLTGLKEKRQKNEETLENNRRAARLYDAQQRQELLQKIAGYYGDAEMTGERDTYMAQAGAQTPNIAANMNSYVKKYDTAPVKVEAPNISAFESPEKQDMSATNATKNTGIFSLMDPRRRERREELAGV